MRPDSTKPKQKRFIDVLAFVFKAWRVVLWLETQTEWRSHQWAYYPIAFVWVSSYKRSMRASDRSFRVEMEKNRNLKQTGKVFQTASNSPADSFYFLPSDIFHIQVIMVYFHNSTWCFSSYDVFYDVLPSLPRSFFGLLSFLVLFHSSFFAAT